MLRKAFVMRVKPDKHGEYRERHRAVWPDLEAVLKAHGLRNYSIFLDEATSQLFAYVEMENEVGWAVIGRNEVFARWWEFMRDIVENDRDGGPLLMNLDEVYHLD